MGNLLGSKRAGARRPAFVGMIAGPLLLTAAACGGGGSGEDNPFTATGQTASDTTETTALQPCAEARHLVAFDIIGMLTLGDYGAINAWSVEGIYPEARPGTAEVAQAYRDRGFEVLYITTLPVSADLYGVPAIEAMQAWLTEKGFPVEPDVTSVWAMDTAATGEMGTSWGTISNELLRIAGEGVNIDAAYTENSDKAYGFATGGVPTEALFTLESLPVEGRREQDTPDYPVGPPTSAVPADDFVAHAAQIAELPAVCEL